MKIPRFFLLAPFMVAWVPLRAQEEALNLDPPLRQAFPLDATANGIRVPYPILLNDHTVLRPDAVLRFIYMDPDAGLGRAAEDGDSGLFRSHMGQGKVTGEQEAVSPDKAGAAGGWGNHDGNLDAGIFDEQSQKADVRRGKTELQTEVWVRKDLFTDALDHATELGTTVVYSLPTHAKPLTATINLPEGMLLAEVNSHVRVLGLTRQSRAFQGGVRAGDEIRGFSADQPVATLSDFVRAYVATKQQAKVSGNPSYAMQIWRPSEGGLVTIQIAAPPKMPSLF